MRIRANCPDCGEVELEQGAIDVDRGEDSEGIYCFVCPECEELVTKPADARVLALLEAAGVAKGPVRDQLEHPESFVGGPPLRVSDLLAFRRALRDEDLLAQLAAE